ncbi:MAG: hypothetical protein KAJ42_18240 [Gemmatimonadetes bacterium]|nr:hypothetical protein [Gemmatimonadota bacterium]
MILRRYGESFHSVEPNFDPRAMNEVGFRRDRAFSISVEELSESYEAGDAHDLVAEAEGPVQTEAEAAVLVDLEAQLNALVEGVGEGGVVVVESEPGQDYPKMKETRSNVIVDGENKFHFRRYVEPPLKIRVYAKRA